MRRHPICRLIIHSLAKLIARPREKSISDMMFTIKAAFFVLLNNGFWCWVNSRTLKIE